MTIAPRQGDVLIRVVDAARYELVDATTRQHIVAVSDLQVAVSIASEHGGAVWRENLDDRGAPLGAPVLLLPRRSTPRS